MEQVEELIRQYRRDEPSAEQLRLDVMALRQRIRGLTQDGVPHSDKVLSNLRENLRIIEQEMLIAEYVEDCIRVTLTEQNIHAALNSDNALDDGIEED